MLVFFFLCFVLLSLLLVPPPSLAHKGGCTSGNDGWGNFGEGCHVGVPFEVAHCGHLTNAYVFLKGGETKVRFALYEYVDSSSSYAGSLLCTSTVVTVFLDSKPNGMWVSANLDRYVEKGQKYYLFVKAIGVGSVPQYRYNSSRDDGVITVDSDYSDVEFPPVLEGEAGLDYTPLLYVEYSNVEVRIDSTRPEDAEVGVPLFVEYGCHLSWFEGVVGPAYNLTFQVWNGTSWNTFRHVENVANGGYYYKDNSTFLRFGEVYKWRVIVSYTGGNYSNSSTQVFLTEPVPYSSSAFSFSIEVFVFLLWVFVVYLAYKTSRTYIGVSLIMSLAQFLIAVFYLYLSSWSDSSQLLLIPSFGVVFLGFWKTYRGVKV
jgi:hypothetical protein